MSKKSSIYENILKAKEEDSNIPYLFQDPQISGREDTLFVLLTEGIPFSRKEDLACECCVILEERLKEQTDFQNDSPLTKFLNEHPLRLFFIELRERLRVLLEHQTFHLTYLHALAMDLVRKSFHPEEVKLGIMILGFFPHDLTNQIFKTLGYHSDYTIYVAESVRHSHFQQNQFIFDLAQHTVGYGKLAALFLLRPITEEQKRWVVKEGIKSSFLSNIYSSLSFQKTDIREYLFNVEISEENYSDLMYFLAYRESSDQENLSEQMLSFMEKIIEKRELATTFIDQAGMVMIWHQVIDNWKQDYEDLDQATEEEEINEYWELRFNRYEELIRSIEIFLNKPKWNVIVNQELGNPVESDYLIVTVLQFMEITPGITSFTSILRRNPLGLHLLDFFLVNHPSYYFTEICVYLKHLLNEDLFRLALEFDEEEVPESHDLFRVNVWLETLFELIIERDIYDEEWLLRGIQYYQPKIRRLALQGLKKNHEKWNDSVINELEQLETLEKNRRNYNLLRILLDPTSQAEKEKRFVKIAKPVTRILATDRKLLDSYINGSHQHDLTVIDALIKKGSILQLVRDKEHELDRHAIAVTLENGYLLGYIPRVDNRVLANLLDNQDILYAVVDSEDIYEADPHITIMLRQREEKPSPKEKLSRKNIVQFPHSTTNK